MLLHGADLLTDPNRRTGPGAAPRWHGSGIYRCGICTRPGPDAAKPMTCQVTVGGRELRYKCKDNSYPTRNVAQVDRLVFGHVRYALTHPRAYELLSARPPEVDAEALCAERKAIRNRLAQMAEDEVLGLKDRDRVIVATERGNACIGEIDELLNATVTSDPLAAVINAPDPVQARADLELADQRLLIDRLCMVTIPPARRGRGFDPTTVDIAPKHSLGVGSLPAEALPAAA